MGKRVLNSRLISVKLKEKLTSDRAVVSTVELILLIPLIFMIFLLVVDTGMYFSNRNAVLNSTQNGARLAGVYGGSFSTPVSTQLGATDDCRGDRTVTPGDIVACAVRQELKNSATMSIKIEKVECGPHRVSKIGDRTWCTVTWKHPTVSGFFGKTNHTTSSAESEVVFRSYYGW